MSQDNESHSSLPIDMSTLTMVLEALKILATLAPYFAGAFQALLKAFHPTDGATAAKNLNDVVSYAEEALNQVANLKFDSDDPVANALGAWNSAYETVRQRAALIGITDAAAIKTAMDIASHKTDTDSPLDVVSVNAGVATPAASSPFSA